MSVTLSTYEKAPNLSTIKNHYYCHVILEAETYCCSGALNYFLLIPTYMLDSELNWLLT